MDLSTFRQLLKDGSGNDADSGGGGGGVGLNAFYIPSADEHQNEYPPEFARRRQFATGFTGSAGPSVVTETKAAMWTDGRYWVQAQQQLDTSQWTLMKTGVWSQGCPSVEEFLTKELKPGDKVGIDPRHVQHSAFESMRSALAKAKVALVPVSENPVDELWGDSDRPPAPSGDIFALDDKYTGQTVNDKLAAVRGVLQTNGCSSLVVTALDEVAWLFNLRGSDVPYSPVFLAYALVTQDAVTIYTDEHRFAPAVLPRLQRSSVSVKPYGAFFDDIATQAPILTEHGDIWVGDKCTEALWRLIPRNKACVKMTPTNELKAIKNDTELQGMRNCHIRDGVALCRFFHWMDAQFDGQRGSGMKLTEITVADKVEEFRRYEEDFVSLSFPSISSVGGNAAMPHYTPDVSTCKVVDNQHVYLLDSGAQYLDGTTDVTRTVHFGEPTAEEKRAFTAVLKGHIALARSIFPTGTDGRTLDALARAPIWQFGLTYTHGTGHGVGSFLNVHEGPMLLSFKKGAATHEGLHAGNVVTIEPGYYQENDFGIRIENVEIVAPSLEQSGFLQFEAVTLVPIQAKMIDRDLLTAEDIKWINDYHDSACRQVIGQQLQERGLVEVMEWLHASTMPL
ncbi:hypothetical protein PTSG_07832 [Salpingoeca rosetta]|uniref:Uncharacterized protein n=1 Tax=Salpingoeca rosetta (strain ATCC 50818 / BSB-021) TaxID=946362 RepID=F2UGG5_SALR5|nr:uncharacterized protein PTSG_07832 [Salpingoeca rosetta]EGD75715.1 hypothetical protein PTSG_07832 [Salpingoeca rosetta]|eukprot:XP_004991636.1 hypothetical protein PTSG_07832 [Salpingoeca rosetta]